MSEKYLKIEQMAEISGLSKMYFYCRKNNDNFNLPLYRIGKVLRCKESDFYSWMESRKA